MNWHLIVARLSEMHKKFFLYFFPFFREYLNVSESCKERETETGSHDGWLGRGKQIRSETKRYHNLPNIFFNNAKPTYALHSIRQSQLRNKYIGTKFLKESSLAVIYELELEGLPTIL